MNVDMDIAQSCTATPGGAGAFTGADLLHWYVAIVNNRSEKAVAEKLTCSGVENYVPTQIVYHLWKNGRKAKVEKVMIPAVVFIKCTEKMRREIVKLPYVFRFMTNKAVGDDDNSCRKHIAIVSDDEVQRMKFMLGQSDIPVAISERPFRVGDRVRVIRGSLAGLEGEVLNMKSAQSELVVSLEFFGCARLLIDTVNLEVIKENKKIKNKTTHTANQI